MSWRWRKSGAGRILAAAGLAVLYLCSIRPVALFLLSPLEGRYPPYSGQHVDFVVVLGGGQYSEASCERLFEGLRVNRANPGSVLVLSGAPCGAPESEAEVMGRMARSLGVPESGIVLEPSSRATFDHPIYARPIVGSRPFAVVTSASHMPRAMMLFRKAGMNPVPAPAVSLTLKLSRSGGFALAPGAGALAASSAAFHEYFGLLWAMLLGQI